MHCKNACVNRTLDLHVAEEVEEEQPTEEDGDDDISFAQAVAQFETSRQERIVARSAAKCH